MLSILQKQRLKRIVARLILAEVRFNQQGKFDPKEWPHIQAEKTKAQEAFEKLLKDDI